MIELKNKIIALCNNSGLPLEAIMFVLKDAYRDSQDSLTEAEIRAARQKASEAPAPEKDVEEPTKVDGEIVEE